MSVTPASRPITATSPLFAVAERLTRLAGQPAPDRLGRVPAALDPALGDAGHGPIRLPRLDRGVADAKISGWPGIVRSGPTRIRPFRSVGGAGRFGDGRRRTASTRIPAAQSVVRAGIRSLAAVGHLDRHGPIVDADDPRPGPDDRAEPLELAPGRRRTIRRVGRQDPVHRLDEQDPGVGRVDRAEVAAERVAGDLAERSGQLDARRPAADDDERHPLAPPLGIVLALGRLERDQDPPPDLGGVVDRLQARRDRGPVVVAEVREARAGADDQRVVADRAAVRQRTSRALRVDADRLAEQDRRVPLPAQDRAQRLGDVARRDRAGRDLVQERREQEVVAPIDERHLDALVLAELLARRTGRRTLRRRSGRGAEWAGWTSSVESSGRFSVERRPGRLDQTDRRWRPAVSDDGRAPATGRRRVRLCAAGGGRSARPPAGGCALGGAGMLGRRHQSNVTSGGTVRVLGPLAIAESHEL